MNPRISLIASVLLAASLNSGVAHAALEGRDLNGSINSVEAYYDTDLNITWLADANYAQTSSYDADGLMTWAAATTWAANLSFTDGINIYGNWRLPTSDTCALYGCTSSEMGHLFYIELGMNANQTPGVTKFTNLQTFGYWSGTEDAFDPTNSAWSFYFSGGLQIPNIKTGTWYALAVSPGDVGIAAVPEASTWAMLLVGLGLVGVATQRRKLAKV
jgi:hypothetical protein